MECCLYIQFGGVAFCPRSCLCFGDNFLKIGQNFCKKFCQPSYAICFCGCFCIIHFFLSSCVKHSSLHLLSVCVYTYIHIKILTCLIHTYTYIYVNMHLHTYTLYTQLHKAYIASKPPLVFAETDTFHQGYMTHTHTLKFTFEYFFFLVWFWFCLMPRYWVLHLYTHKEVPSND